MDMIIPEVWMRGLFLGFCLDLILGDPHWMPHPVKGIGFLIQVLEKILRKIFPKNPKGERTAGVVLVWLVVGISVSVTMHLLITLETLSPSLCFFFQVWLSYQLLATKSLQVESNKVYQALMEKDLEKARLAVSMIVGRDTEQLDEMGITKATVETVAENASDGVVAPLLFMAMGGVSWGIIYKAVNTLDSMVGYQNETYLHFGRCAAKTDDFFNFIPSRISGLMMCLGAFLVGEDGKNAYRILDRDRNNHKSPNSAYTESACAGALGIQLGGRNLYFGKMVEKPTIGDKTRKITPEDILKSHKLLYATVFLTLIIFCVIPLVVLYS